MTTKPNPFLAGMRATGREAFTTDEARKEYEAGYSAINSMIEDIEEVGSMIDLDLTSIRALVSTRMSEIEATWSRIKAAIASEVKP